jgi:hypothetical protein
MVGNGWEGNSFVTIFTNKGRVDFVFGGRETVIDIEPITINISVFEFNTFADIGFVSGEIISTEFISWFIGSFPRFEEER